ncbi:MAG: glucose-1-phosphate adenylyltransferase subunit GlgD [Eubacteriales bacterium]|nr:glucose-1-phosphate adenylyltransferase subunit GlgD [Eubacteriales bacterium]
MSVVGIIFSNIHDKNVPDLTKSRTMASVPFGCRYRLIDFTLSNMVHSGINHVGVITHYNYQSLMDHLGSGKDWDLARRAGGIQILPPYITAFANPQNFLYSTRLEALKNIISFISGCTEDYVVLCDCDVISNIDLNEIIDYHIASHADATMMIKRMYLTSENANHVQTVKSNDDGRLTAVTEYTGRESGFSDINTNIWVMSRRFLESIVTEAIAYNYNSFIQDIVQKNIGVYNFRIYRHESYFATIDSMQTYYICSMDLLNERVRHGLFNVPGRPILTKVRNSPPTVYAEGADVRNSLVADGCIINGTVENSVLFRGVTVGRNTVIKNSILMQDTIVGDNVNLHAVITDKNAVIRDGRTLSGHETLPFYIGKFTQI